MNSFFANTLYILKDIVDIIKYFSMSSSATSQTACFADAAESRAAKNKAYQ